ncbi:MAG: peptidylprolyl isomerase, partial [Calditrichia bacterium]
LADLEENFAAAAAKLGKMDVSQPVRTRWGYHIVQLLDRKDAVFLKEDEYSRQRPLLEKRVKRRKGALLSARYVSSVLRELNPQPVPPTFGILWRALNQQDNRPSLIKNHVQFSGRMIGLVKQKLRDKLNEPLIQHRNGFISLGQFLNSLKQIPVSSRPRFRSPRDLSDAMGKWVRDEFLLKEARRKKLETHPRVRQEVLQFAEQQSYLWYLNQEMENISIPPSVREYFESRNSRRETRPAELTGFHTLQEWLWQQAEEKLHSRLLQEVPAEIFINEKMLREESRSINWQGRIRMMAVRKPQ